MDVPPSVQAFLKDAAEQVHFSVIHGHMADDMLKPDLKSVQ